MALNRVDVSKDKAGKFACHPTTVEVSKKKGDGIEWVCRDGSITRIVWGNKGNPFPGPPVGSGGRWEASGPPNGREGTYGYDLTVNVGGKDETADPNVEVIP